MCLPALKGGEGAGFAPDSVPAQTYHKFKVAGASSHGLAKFDPPNRNIAHLHVRSDYIVNASLFYSKDNLCRPVRPRWKMSQGFHKS